MSEAVAFPLCSGRNEVPDTPNLRAIRHWTILGLSALYRPRQIAAHCEDIMSQSSGGGCENRVDQLLLKVLRRQGFRLEHCFYSISSFIDIIQ